jgi:ferric-dicitrate binding protein FerR (iron transport regulator)
MTAFNEQILFQYFSGTASPLQKKLILEWLQEEANRELFYQYLEKWEKDHVQFIPGLEQATENIMHRLDHFPDTADMEADEPAHKTTVFPIRKRWWAAASLLLVLGLSYYIFQGSINYIRYQTAYGEVKEFTLADGSHVILNANSSLLVPRWKFKTGDRTVTLKGEAAFSVVHTQANQKFLVNTESHLNVEVLGTEFSVYNRDSRNRIELKKGSVKILFNKQKNIEPFILKPGDVASLGINGRLLVRHRQPPASFIPWKEHRFLFDNTSLSEALHAIKEFFGEDIIIGNPALNDKNITGSFKAESAKELLSVLAEINDLELSTESGAFVLREKGRE